MAAYAAVISLENTIQRIQDPSRFSSVPEVTELLNKELKQLKEILKRLDNTRKSKSRKKVNDLDEQIKEAVWRVEDSLELHLSDQIASLQSKCRNNNVLSKEEEEEEEEEEESDLQHKVDSFIETVRDMEKKYMHELDNLPEDEEEDDDESAAVSSLRIDSNRKGPKMVGLSDLFTCAKWELLLNDHRQMRAVSLIGMAGIGKTTLAEKLFQDPLILKHFDYRVWVTVGRKSKVDGFFRCILAQVDPVYMVTSEGDDETIVECLKERFEGKKCLIVLDDVWETHVLDYVTSSLLNKLQINDVGRIRILLTARERFKENLSSLSNEVMRLMKKEESEELLCEKVFGEGTTTFPPELEKAGKKIAKKCEGLPLMIVTVAEHLSKVDKDPQYWKEVAEQKNSVFEDAYDKIYKVLLPSYEYLPQLLKFIFLYIGMFPQDYEIPRSQLINLLVAEGYNGWSIITCLNDLHIRHNLLIIIKRSIEWRFETPKSLKSCRLHSTLRHLCKREARKNKSFRILNCHGLHEEEEEEEEEGGGGGLQGERRLCVYSNNLLAIKQVYNAVQSADCASTARSLLCLGPYHQYPVPILDVVDFKLLRVLDALKVRFYQFPIQILKLVQLRYLALTYSKNLPPSISKLFNLQFLIIHPHTNIKICGDPSLIPVQIWDMKTLKHIEITESCLPNPTSDAALKRLSTLLGLSASSCTSGVLGKTPNLHKLGIQIEWGHSPLDDTINPLSCFDHISKLENLHTLKCNIVNPRYVFPLTPLSFPSFLRKLHLSGLGYPWEYMNVIGSLLHLEVLKLRCYAFRGPKWEAEERSFRSLKFLLIEDSDLVQWIPGDGSFPELNYLSMRHCYKLQKLEYWPRTFCIKPRIELVDCNPSAVTCVNKLQLTAFAALRITTTSSFRG